MNVELICIRCMREKEAGQNACPWCGFDAASYSAPEGALPPMTILHGRYLAGCSVMEKYTFAYSAIDLENEKRVRIRELFMPGLMTRRAGTLDAKYEMDATEIMLSAARQFYRIGQDAAGLGSLPGMYAVSDVFDENNTIYQVSELPDTSAVPCSRLNSGEHVSLRSLQPVLEAVKALNLVQITPCLLDRDHVLITADGSAKLDFVPVPYEEKQGSNVWFAPDGDMAEKDGAAWGTWSDVYACGRLIRGLGTEEQLGKKGQEALEKALSSSPDARPQTMEVFLSDILANVKEKKAPGKGRIVVECLIALAISLAVGALIYYLISRTQNTGTEPSTETEVISIVEEPQDLTEADTEAKAEAQTEKETQAQEPETKAQTEAEPAPEKETAAEPETEKEAGTEAQTDKEEPAQEEETEIESEKNGNPLQGVISL